MASSRTPRPAKPANVLLDRDGQPRVADFGLGSARTRPDGQMSVTGQVVGTPSLHAPRAGHRVGRRRPGRRRLRPRRATSTHLLTGRPPFHAATPVETLRQVRGTGAGRLPAAWLNAALDRDLETICLCCLHKKEPAPAAHPGGQAALAEDLGRFQRRGESIRGTGPSAASSCPCGGAGGGRRPHEWQALLASPSSRSWTVGLATVSTAVGRGRLLQRRRSRGKDAGRGPLACPRPNALPRRRGKKTRDEDRARVQAQPAPPWPAARTRPGSVPARGSIPAASFLQGWRVELVPDEADDLHASRSARCLGRGPTNCAHAGWSSSHPNNVKAADLSARVAGRRVATASGDIVQVWDAITGQPIGPPLHSTPLRVHAVAASSPDGRLLLTGCDDHSVAPVAANGDRPARGQSTGPREPGSNTSPSARRGKWL